MDAMQQRRLIRFVQAYTAFGFTLPAADFSAMHGVWGRRLGVPLSWLAMWTFLLVPIVVLTACVLPKRIPGWARILGCDIIAICIASFPLVVFNVGTAAVTLNDSEASAVEPEELERLVGFPVLMVSDRNGSHVYFHREHDPSLVCDALRRLGIKPNSQ
jgi:hypothetical protein